MTSLRNQTQRVFALALALMVLLAGITAHAQASSSSGSSTHSSSASSSHDATSSTTSDPGSSAEMLNFLDGFRKSLPSLVMLWTGNAYCTWEGIRCVDDYVRIDLSAMNLGGQLPGVDIALSTSVKVASIRMHGNPKLTGVLPDSWKRLIYVEEINLDDTAITGTIPKAWTEMVSLRTLSLKNARLCGGLPDWSISALTTVDLSGNRMGGQLSATWADMSALEAVYLTGNGFCGCVPKTWADVPALDTAAKELGNRINSERCVILNKCGQQADRCAKASAAGGPVVVAGGLAAVAATMLWTL